MPTPLEPTRAQEEDAGKRPSGPRERGWVSKGAPPGPSP